MKITWTPKAISSLNRIFDYILLDNPKIAQKVKQRIVDKSNLLQSTPFIGTQYEMDIRRLSLGDFPYTIYYRVKNNQIEILQVRHNMRSVSKKYN